MQKIRNVEIKYTSCDFCNEEAGYYNCFICGKDICKKHGTEFDIIDYDLVYICPDCKNKDYTELKKLNDKYMRLCKVGSEIQKNIIEEIEKLK